VYKGFKTAFEVYQGGLRLLIDPTSKIVREESLHSEIQRKAKEGYSDKEIAESLIIGRSFLTQYGNSRIVKIDDVDFTGNAGRPFPNGQYKSYEDYFFRSYGIQLRCKEQWFLIRSVEGRGQQKPKKEVYLPELLKSVGIEESLRKDREVLKAFSAHTITDPEQRFEEIFKISGRICKATEEKGVFELERRLH
jgi:hypothetical protein